MKKYILAYVSALLMVGCQNESVRFEIDSLPDELHLQVSSEHTSLNPALPGDTAIFFTWQWAQPTKEITGYTYYFKMDRMDNQFETSIPRMALEGDSCLAFTHKQFNKYMEEWGIKPGELTWLEAEIIAIPEGLDHYVKPMISKTTFSVTGYASTLFAVGSAVPGEGTTPSFQLNKEPGAGAYGYTGHLLPGELRFVDQATENGYQYCSVTIAREGWYVLHVNTESRQVEMYEPLYLVGDAAPSGWNLRKAVQMTNVTPSRLTWTGVLNAGELKFACNAPSGLFEDPFYQAEADHMTAEGTTATWFNNTADTELDYKWYVEYAGIYTIDIDLDAATVTFTFDGGLDDLPYQNVYIVGSAMPCGWDIGSPETMTYDFMAAEKGTFTWTGTVTDGELKFSLDKDPSWGGEWIMAPEAGASITPVCTGVYSPNGSPDNKWVVKYSESGEYTITVNVYTYQVTFTKH